MLPDHDHKNFPFLVIQYELSWSIMICFLALAMNMIILGLTYRYVIPMVYVAWSMNEITLMIDSLFQYIKWIICLFWYTQYVLYQYLHILHAMELRKKYSNLVDMGSSSCYFQFEVSYLKFKNFLSHKKS